LSVFKGRLGEMLANTLTIAVHHGRKGFRPHPQLNVRNAATLRLPYALAIASGTTLTLYFQLLQR
jgi:prepilin peptidase CpaA